ncbi:MAG: tyrosine-protein phosphatase [Bacteroidaceae bacterium]|nr:tyrosine-protein phosphatase [Bacteroidaceae bacterium]
MKKYTLISLPLLAVIGLAIYLLMLSNNLNNSQLNPLKDSQEVVLDDVDNCRQFGGYTNKDGKRIKQNLLFRSGKLCKLTDEGTEEFKRRNIKTVIDLRIPEEIEEKPDPKIEGVKHNVISIVAPESQFYRMSKNGVGVNADNYSDVVNAIAKTPMNLGDMYIEGIIDSPYGQKALRKVFRTIIDSTDGALLWHCSGGKDRTGIVAALLLAALDVPQQTILDDYELTNNFVPGQRVVLWLASKHFGNNDKERERVATIAGVKRSFMEHTLNHINQHYGSPQKYITNQIGITPEDINTLKTRYLE